MRPIGNHVRRVMAILEDRGPSTYLDVHAGMSVCKENAKKYCLRAVALGLATSDRLTRPATYTAIPGWQDAAIARRVMYQRPAPPPKPRVSFVVGAHNPFGDCYFSDAGQADREGMNGAN